MRKFFLLLALVPLLGMAQSDSAAVAVALRFGVVDFSRALCSLPDYTTTMARLEGEKAKYQAEAKRAEDDFNAKYEEFLEQQKDYPLSIRRKRQNELQQLMDDNIAFRKEAQKLMAQAEKEALLPLRERLAAIIAQIAGERGYAFVLNTQADACPYINPAQGEDITAEIEARAATTKIKN